MKSMLFNITILVPEWNAMYTLPYLCDVRKWF